ncbi:hypothetical protein EPN83_00795 [Patescibacteria group bacterium]|nr:MAG: hypothetical protein EPN83_00795 [Patescibacteria group bacterium]
MRSSHIFLVPYAYDRLNKNKQEGKGTRARCDALIEVIRRIPEEEIVGVILTAGFTKENPRAPSNKHRISLAEQMSAYLQLCEWKLEGKTTVEPCTWGTLGETVEAIRIAEALCRRRQMPPKSVEIFVSSNPLHLYGRIALCWFALKPRGWRVRLVPARHRFTWRECLRELFVKIPYCAFTLLGMGFLGSVRSKTALVC